MSEEEEVGSRLTEYDDARQVLSELYDIDLPEPTEIELCIPPLDDKCPMGYVVNDNCCELEPGAEPSKTTKTVELLPIVLQLGADAASSVLLDKIHARIFRRINEYIIKCSVWGNLPQMINGVQAERVMDSLMRIIDVPLQPDIIDGIPTTMSLTPRGICAPDTTPPSRTVWT